MKTKTLTLLTVVAVSLGTVSVVVPSALSAANSKQLNVRSAVSLSLYDLDADVIVESKIMGADGVLRTTRFEETLMRRASVAWVKRVLPTSVRATHKDDAQKHKHFNPIEAGRVVTAQPDGAQLSFVNADEKVVVSVPKPEFANVGFDGSWERAYHLVTASELATMKPVTSSAALSAAPEGAQWLQRHVNGIREYVLWDKTRAIALVIETSNDAATKWYRVTVKPKATLVSPVPWLQTQGFEQKGYVDYLD